VNRPWLGGGLAAIGLVLIAAAMPLYGATVTEIYNSMGACTQWTDYNPTGIPGHGQQFCTAWSTVTHTNTYRPHVVLALVLATLGASLVVVAAGSLLFRPATGKAGRLETPRVRI